MLKKCYDRSSIGCDILKQSVITLDSANKYGDAGSSPQRFGEQLTAVIDIGH
jgi:hypothetical protein